jgi:alpha-galactosidase/6-phospho-beta-glucosidase family protein
LPTAKFALFDIDDERLSTSRDHVTSASASTLGLEKLRITATTDRHAA